MYYGIKCTEIEKTTTATDQESLNPTDKSAVCSLTVSPLRIYARVITIAIIKRRQANGDALNTTTTGIEK